MIRIQPKEYISQKFIMDYYFYIKKEAIKRYKNKFPQFSIKELSITWQIVNYLLY